MTLHAQHRAAERYRLQLRTRDIAALVDIIEAGAATYEGDAPGDTTVWLIAYAGRTLRAVYAPGAIITLLPVVPSRHV